ncbi:hypothetical protein ACFL6C_07490 [Myxococcota bacterium]
MKTPMSSVILSFDDAVRLVLWEIKTGRVKRDLCRVRASQVRRAHGQTFWHPTADLSMT